MTIAEEGLARARRSGARMSVAFLGNNLSELYAIRGRLAEALPLHHEAIAAAQAIGMRASSGLDGLAKTLLELGRFDEARETWQQANEAEPVREPQDRADAAMLDAIFAWAEDPAQGIRRLRDADDARQAGWPVYVFEILTTLGRMAVRAGDSDAAEYAAAIVRDPRPGETFGIEAFSVATSSWIEGLANPDRAAGARAVAGAAATFEEYELPLRSADAYTDAALLAERGELPADAARWRARAEELYAPCSAVPVLDRIRASIADPA